MTSTITRIEYAQSLLAAGGFPFDPANERDPKVVGLVAVMAGEESQAVSNPLDTTWPLPGAWPYNSFGPNGEDHVWNYATLTDGIEATLLTIRQAIMAPIVGALDLPSSGAVVEDSTGTGTPTVQAALASSVAVVQAFDACWAGSPIALYQSVLPRVQATWPAAGLVQVPVDGEVPPVPGPTPQPPTQKEIRDMVIAKLKGTDGPWYQIGGYPLGKRRLTVDELAAVDGLGFKLEPDADAAWLLAIPDR